MSMEKKKLFIVHGWGGSPKELLHKLLKDKFSKIGFEEIEVRILFNELYDRAERDCCIRPPAIIAKGTIIIKITIIMQDRAERDLDNFLESLS